MSRTASTWTCNISASTVFVSGSYVSGHLGGLTTLYRARSPGLYLCTAVTPSDVLTFPASFFTLRKNPFFSLRAPEVSSLPAVALVRSSDASSSTPPPPPLRKEGFRKLPPPPREDDDGARESREALLFLERLLFRERLRGIRTTTLSITAPTPPPELPRLLSLPWLLLLFRLRPLPRLSALR